jgi:hypothetical protein
MVYMTFNLSEVGRVELPKAATIGNESTQYQDIIGRVSRAIRNYDKTADWMEKVTGSLCIRF